MANEPQIAANKAQCAEEFGARPPLREKGASKNAFRHGLSKPMLGPKFTRAVEHLARRIAVEGADASALELAREAARGMLELDRVRRIEVALITRVVAFGRLEPAKILASQRDEVAWVMQHLLGVKLSKS